MKLNTFINSINISLALILFSVSCKKEISEKYRAKYTGEFIFTVVGRHWGETVGGVMYDTVVYNGTIVLYDKENTSNDRTPDYYNAKDSKRITINFLEYSCITPEIDKDGNLIEFSGAHYHHKGGFVNINEIEFSITGLGGLGGGVDYYINGKRI